MAKSVNMMRSAWRLMHRKCLWRSVPAYRMYQQATRYLHRHGSRR